MSVVFSGTNQGTFVSNGNAQLIPLRSNVDWMMVYNYTQMGDVQTPGRVVQAYWQRGMAPGAGIIYAKADGVNTLEGDTLTTGGFTLYDNTINIPGPAVAITSISGANPPRVLVGSTAALSDGMIVRIFNTTGALQLGSFDFTITVADGTHFDLEYMAPIVAAAGPGSYRVIPYNPYFYPPTRIITKISPRIANATQAVVTLSVTHAFTVGQTIRFVVPTVTAAAFGMPQLNGVQANIIDVGEADADGKTNTITVDVDVSGFGTFAWPLTTNPAFTPAQVVPVGENSAISYGFSNPANIPNFAGSNTLGDSEVNLGQIGMILGAGALSPAGENGDVIYWLAGKSYNGI